MFEVVYCSKTGNTKKVAEAIAAELGVVAEDVNVKEGLAEDSFVLLGSGCYIDEPGGELKEFITRNDFKGRQVALFGTSEGGKGNEVRVMEKLLKPKGALVKGIFYCKGQDGSLNIGHPSDDDLAQAREFARLMKKS